MVEFGDRSKRGDWRRTSSIGSAQKIRPPLKGTCSKMICISEPLDFGAHAVDGAFLRYDLHLHTVACFEPAKSLPTATSARQAATELWRPQRGEPRLFPHLSCQIASCGDHPKFLHDEVPAYRYSCPV